MYWTKQEEKIIGKFYKYVSETRPNRELYLLSWKNGTKILVNMHGWSDDDNGLELEDPNYEEYTSFIMDLKRIDNFDDRDGIKLDKIKKYKAIILNYHNFPDEIYNSNGELISKRKK